MDCNKYIDADATDWNSWIFNKAGEKAWVWWLYEGYQRKVYPEDQKRMGLLEYQ